ncbi:DUF4912 domain-containing protein [Rossellomorea vietnamensis]|uniref:DUF4912 domain-containing protein n=1 Tax=Rossellomorea vietnamensis TaxID=218284 RepID=A0ACD4C6V5_9BACI|nr:DUF4912 domain-containing protein [Rossellomorea vietnamensis]UXH44400.1 DUF4912 domain-containing protein [Rossellomorea vietnamensis]
MITEIIKLKEQGVSFRKIAKELNTTVGKVQYQWVKYQKALGNGPEPADVEMIKPEAPKKRVGRAAFGRKMPRLRSKNPKATELSITFSTSSRIYCYWNISHEWIRHVKAHFKMNTEPQPFVLRLYDITSISFNGHNQHHYSDSYVPFTETDWFVNGLKENRSYCMEIGLRLPSGDFVAFTRSNVIHTPRTSHHQEAHSMKELMEYEQGLIREPKWVEHVSTYSYYVMNGEEKA